MESRHLNLLANASSAYLRSAMAQPVQWQEWGDDAFRQAAEEDKPILLDIGAVWCHWCHVMDRESYDDEVTASIINDHFIAVKVDRDERQDVDTRYQAAVAAISGQGGWPLTAFLTPSGIPFFGGTYFPPEDRHGRPSFQRVLLTMAAAFRERRSEVDESASSVMAAIEQNETFSGRSGNPGPELVAQLVESALKQFDRRSGGFGSQPKFPHSGALDLLIDVTSRISAPNKATADQAREAAVVTLEKMAKGGICDHLAGGFHRYSVDERWIVPHFEKMAYDNSGLLKNYVHAFQTFVEPSFGRVAREIVGWMDTWLSDREHGGFYASQDADVTPDDDGDYFTWTRDEAAEVLTPEELAVAAAFYEIGEVGNMHHNPAKNVLHITGTLERVAHAAKVSLDEASNLVHRAKRKLYAARLLRPAPYIDKTIYVGWNAMCISAYLEAGRVLELPEATSFALKTLDRILKTAWTSEAGMKHVVAYGEASAAPASIPGTLDDFVFTGHAALDAWEATGELSYYNAARAIADSTIQRFYDRADRAFSDTAIVDASGEPRLGALIARRRPIQDAPTPAGNPVAASLLLRLEEWSGNDEYLVIAQETLETFAGVVEHFGLYAATYGLALQQMLQRNVQVCIVGEDADARKLESIALARYAVNKSVLRLKRTQVAALPPAFAATMQHLSELRAETGRSFAVVCSHNTCHPPVTSVDALIETMNKVL